MSAGVSIVIVAVALVMLCIVFFNGIDRFPLVDGKPDSTYVDAFQRQKDILLIAMGLLGTVTGYYFGRVPAERGADAARAAQKQQRRRQTTFAQQERRRSADSKPRSTSCPPMSPRSQPTNSGARSIIYG
jgi:hypothetical protein